MNRLKIISQETVKRLLDSVKNKNQSYVTSIRQLKQKDTSRLKMEMESYKANINEKNTQLAILTLNRL